MRSSDLFVIVGVIVALLLFPLLTMILVRLLIPLKPVEELAEENDTPLEFESLRDFWESNVPHLVELRDRLLKSIAAIGVCTGIGAFLVYNNSLFGEPLPQLIVKHFAGADVKLLSIQVGEVFASYMRIALVFGIALSIPFVLYQIIAFLAPALHPSEKRVVFTVLPFVSELFIAGMAFGWFITVPAAVQFLVGFGESQQVDIRPTVENFFGIVTTLLLWNGVIFELPAIVYLLARIGLVNAPMLARTRRYAIVIIVIFAAVITPTGDPYNLMLLAVPMYLLYELGIFLARLVPRPQEELAVAVNE